MNILFLFISLPNLQDNAVYVDLIKEFAKNGHDVKVATPLRSNTVEGLNKEAGIDVVRFKTDQIVGNTSNIKKGIAYIKLIYQYQKAIKTYYSKENFDLIISHSLPPEIGIVVKKLKNKYKSKFYLILNEFVWQNSVSFGFFKESNIICKYYKWLENKLVNTADYIGCPSQGNIDFTLKYHLWAKHKNIDILNYAQYPISVPNTEENIREKHNIVGKFVAIYGGSVSIAQKMENVLLLAESCLEYKNIVFLIVGQGSYINEAKYICQEKNISNIYFIDYMPQKDYLQLLSACDVGIVSLNEKLVVPNIPSKTLTYFSLKKPIVASIDRNTDYGKLLELSDGGLWSYAGDIEGFKQNILSLYNSYNRCKQMGLNGYKYFIENMIPTKAYNSIIKQIER